MKSAQMGVTEVGINRALWTVDVRKKDVLYVLPTQINAGDFSQARFAVALELSPELAKIFTSTNKVNLKQAGNTNLYIRGSRGDSNLKSIPVGVMFLDELDEMDQRQIWLALERLSGHVEKEVWAISTPTIPDYGIHKLYQTTTQEHFVFKCPCCSRQTELVWPDCFQLAGESVYDVRCAESFLKCKECGGKLEHKDKPEYLGTGTWQVTDHNANPEMRGFYINQMYSYTINPGELAVAYHRGLGDEAADQEFNNSKLGLPKLAESARVSETDIAEAIRDYQRNIPLKPRDQKIITLGVDQGKWNYYTVCEWDVDRWGNDINESSTPKVLEMGKFKEEDWDVLYDLMPHWKVLACVLDADPQINEARRFARKFWGYVWLCRYRKVPTAKEIVIHDSDSGAPIATVDRTNWASAALGRFRRKKVMLPRDTPEEYKDHLKNLVKCYQRDDDGDMVATFVKTGPDHFAHSLIYSEIALPFAATIKTGQNITKFI